MHLKQKSNVDFSQLAVPYAPAFVSLMCVLPTSDHNLTFAVSLNANEDIRSIWILQIRKDDYRR